MLNVRVLVTDVPRQSEPKMNHKPSRCPIQFLLTNSGVLGVLLLQGRWFEEPGSSTGTVRDSSIASKRPVQK